MAIQSRIDDLIALELAGINGYPAVSGHLFRFSRQIHLFKSTRNCKRENPLELRLLRRITLSQYSARLPAGSALFLDVGQGREGVQESPVSDPGGVGPAVHA